MGLAQSSGAEQAASEGLDPERAVRVTRLDPDPWDLGAVKAITCPNSAEVVRRVRLVKTSAAVVEGRAQLNSFSRALTWFDAPAFCARDAIEEQIAGKPTNPNVVARELNRAGGNPTMTVNEFNSDCPF